MAKKKTRAPSPHRVAVVQHPPVALDRDRTLRRGVDLVAEAATGGAKLVAFPEAWVPGYPEWLWRLRPANDYAMTGEFHALLLENSVDLAKGQLKPIQAAARKHRTTVVIGINERESSFGRATIYNSVVTVGPDGEILNRHRKLVATNAERMVWGPGDASGLNVVETPSGRLGALICWENYMPLARFAIFAQGCQIYVAPTWDEGEGWVSTMRHIAREGRCWVLGAGNAQRGRDMPASFPHRAKLFPDLDEWFNPGDSVIVAPSGDLVAGPLSKKHGILYADCDPARADAAKRSIDVTGHYGRPDIFRLEVDREPRVPVHFAGRR